MTTVTQTAARVSAAVDAARAAVRDAEAAKDEAGRVARAAAREAKADPDNDRLADAARRAHNARRRAARALGKAQDALAEVLADGPTVDAPVADGPAADAPAATPPSTLDAAREELRRAQGKQVTLAEATRAAEVAAESDPENTVLFAAARKARWDELKAGKAVQRATEALADAEKAAGVVGVADDPADATAAVSPAGSPTGDERVDAVAQPAAAPASEPDAQNAPVTTDAQNAPVVPEASAEDAVAVPAGDADPVAEAERRVAEADEAVRVAEAAAETDSGDKQLAAVARRARSEQRKATRALKKAREAAEATETPETTDTPDAPGAGATAGVDGTPEGAVDTATTEVSEITETPEVTDTTSAPADRVGEPVATVPASFLRDALALVRSGASVLAVAADASEQSAAADPGNARLADAARAARTAAERAADAVTAAEILHGVREKGQATTTDHVGDTTTDHTGDSATSDTADGAASDAPAVPDDPAVAAAREELRRAGDTATALAEATKQAEAAAEAEPGNTALFAAARKARWDELKATKAVQKATVALEKAEADAPPAPKVLTEEEKQDRAAPKPQGQWIIDGHKPLNGDEEIKREDAGLAVADRVRTIYSKRGFDSIPAEDLAPRFKWIGMYTQRRQDMDGEQTGTLTNAELQDRYFMLRVRLDGGQVTPRQLRVIGEISSTFARGSADFTDRQNIQLHWIRIEDVPEIWDRLATVGLDTYFGCGDVPRVILGSPVAGISKDEIIDGTPAIREIKEKWLIRDEFSNLPRKFKSAISGNRRQDVTHEIQDLAFVGSEHPEKGPGFDIWVGGGLSTNPMLSQRLGAWVSLEEIPEVWVGVVRIFRDYGYRKLRNRARLKFLVADWGIEKFRRILEDDYLGHKLTDGPSPEIWPGYRDHVGVHEQRNGKFYVGVKPTVGHTEGDQLQRLADLAESHGVRDIRTTPDKELLFLNVAPEAVDGLTAALEKEGLSAKPSSFRRDIISCTGLEFCKLALVTTKQRAITLADQLESRLGDLDVPLKISLNGCPNSCARTQVADIGLKGQIVTDDDGNRVEGFQVHLGGALGMHPDWGKKLRGHKVTSAGLDDYVVRVVEHYKEHRTDGEQFRDWVLRAPEEQLQ